MKLTAELAELIGEIWTELEQGALDAKSAFHTPVLGTLGANSCRLRTVVLRRVEPGQRQLICHTDLRSDKVAEIRQNPAVSWLFYSPAAKIQIRAEGRATVHYQDEIARAGWERSQLMSRRCYLIEVGPGTKTDQPESGLPADMLDRSPTAEESEAGWPNFALIASTIERLDWLYLDSKGHRRAQFEWTGENFVGSWVIP
jgi:3-hydroxyisobutyrate dehydrogenase